MHFAQLFLDRTLDPRRLRELNLGETRRATDLANEQAKLPVGDGREGEDHRCLGNEAHAHAVVRPINDKLTNAAELAILRRSQEFAPNGKIGSRRNQGEAADRGRLGKIDVNDQAAVLQTGRKHQSRRKIAVGQ